MKMFYLIGFIISILLSYRIYKIGKNVTCLYHLYFSVFSTFFIENKELLYTSYIYFILDLIVLIKLNKINVFTYIHHAIAIFGLIYLTNNIEYIDFINKFKIMEASNIVLDLYGFNIINSKIKNILFPIVFIFVRLIIFNVLVYNHSAGVVTSVIIFATNCMNLYITFIMMKKYRNTSQNNRI